MVEANPIDICVGKILKVCVYGMKKRKEEKKKENGVEAEKHIHIR